MKLTNDQKKQIKEIYKASRTHMIFLVRFARPGHPWFNVTLPYYRHFKRRFKQLGEMADFRTYWQGY